MKPVDMVSVRQSSLCRTYELFHDGGFALWALARSVALVINALDYSETAPETNGSGLILRCVDSGCFIEGQTT
jgi:hypothetical protein